ncbi:MAG: subclass B1 metallo-beta-lactamase [Bacteroidia bacterium]
MRPLLFFCMLAFTVACTEQAPKHVGSVELHPDLKIEQISPHSFIHISNLETESWGKVPCNGLVHIKNGKALVFDTPSYDSLSEVLIEWIEQDMGASIEGVIANHFHIDCTGGLGAFHDRGIPSYGSALTQEIARARGEKVIQNTFTTNREEINIPNGPKCLNIVLGEAHTRDNIVSYLPEEKILFGGCMVKSLSAKKGNLADANPEAWANTIRNVKAQFPEVEIIIPGHGKSGGIELLDYTIELFESNE